MNEKSKKFKPEFYNLTAQNAAKKCIKFKITKNIQKRASKTMNKTPKKYSRPLSRSGNNNGFPPNLLSAIFNCKIWVVI